MADVVFIALLAIVVVRPQKLPQLLRKLGGVLAELRRAKNNLREQLLAHTAEPPPDQASARPPVAKDTISVA